MLNIKFELTTEISSLDSCEVHMHDLSTKIGMLENQSRPVDLATPPGLDHPPGMALPTQVPDISDLDVRVHTIEWEIWGTGVGSYKTDQILHMSEHPVGQCVFSMRAMH